MIPPLFVRPLTEQEQRQLKSGLRSAEKFTIRRCQILLASAGKEPPSRIATILGCATQTVRNAIREFNIEGIASVEPESRRPKTVQPIFNQDKCDHLKALLHESPRAFGKAKSTWTLELVAEVCFERAITSRRVSDETIRDALKRMQVSWERAKHWIISPDPRYALKKTTRPSDGVGG
jgi:transposase